MRKLFTLCLLIVSLSATAQWQQTGSKVRYVNGLGIPTRDTAAGVLADSSQIVIRPADSSLYVKYKRTWLRVGGGGGSIAGSGTTNYIPKFTSSTAIGNSQIFDNGTGVGIGTASPTQYTGGALGINILSSTTTSEIKLTNSTTGNTSAAGLILTQIGNNGFVVNASNGTLSFGTNDTERMRITSGGNVGIGYTAPAAKLAVSGTTLINTNTDNGVDKLQVSGSSFFDGSVGIGATNPGGGQLYVNSGILASSNSAPVTFRAIGNTNNNTFRANNTMTFGSIGNRSGLVGGSGSNDSIMTLRGETHLVFASGGANERVRITSSGGNVLISTTTDNNTDKLQVNGSIQGTGFNQAYTAKTGTYTATTSDYFIDCTSGTFTVNIFTAVGNTGRILIIKNSGAGTITVDPNGAQTIDGAATQSLSTQWSRVHIISDGTNWKIISN